MWKGRNDNEKSKKTWELYEKLENADNPRLCCARFKILSEKFLKLEEEEKIDQLRVFQRSFLIIWIRQNKELIKDCPVCKKGSESFLRRHEDIPFEANCTECKKFGKIIPILYAGLSKNENFHYRDFCLPCLKKFRNEVNSNQEGDSNVSSYLDKQIKILEEELKKS